LSGSLRLPIPAVIEETRLMAILRHTEPRLAVKTAEALAAGGVRALEVTLNSAGALDMVRTIGEALGDRVLLGVGTVLSTEAADASFEVGARFVVTPHTDEALIGHVVGRGVPIIPGAFTASEVVRAWRAGASAVKLFPSGPVGPAYLKDLRGPLSDVPFVPTGGLTLGNAQAFVDAGAWGLGLGSALADPKVIAAEDWTELTRRAAAFSRIARAAR
jgi:2-dehydro-3-deoxyphosphogluconate aldolase/(4S)-4-hydroxy-2-oxoglutarate aldolase